jgi:hypothetical protein
MAWQPVHRQRVERLVSLFDVAYKFLIGLVVVAFGLLLAVGAYRDGTLDNVAPSVRQFVGNISAKLDEIHPGAGHATVQRTATGDDVVVLSCPINRYNDAQTIDIFLDRANSVILGMKFYGVFAQTRNVRAAVTEGSYEWDLNSPVSGLFGSHFILNRRTLVLEGVSVAPCALFRKQV